VTSVRWLSDTLPGLSGTPGDTRVYVLESFEPGGTAVVVGGTHGNEIAGIMTAVLLVERARVLRGRLIVIPHANNSAMSAEDSERPGPEWIVVKTPAGSRRFKYGARRTRPEHQGAPDPVCYRHPGSAEELDGEEARNLDRAYPGDPAGPLTQRVAAGILKLLIDEGADLAFDLHEAGPRSRLAWMIVAHPKNIDMAALAVLQLEEAGVEMKLEPSSETFRGLSHREWGDETSARAFLFETPNPGQATKPVRARVADDPALSLERRVGVQLRTLRAVLDVHGQTGPASLRIELGNLPTLAEIERDGLGAFLAAPAPSPAPAPDLPAKADTAERLIRRAMQVIREARERTGPGAAERSGPDGIFGMDVDRRALLGAELTPLVTTLGRLESKELATDPRWARLLVHQLAARGLGPGAVVAASFSGSFPGLNLAVMAASQALGARLVAVSSVTASTWGANEPGFTWPEMEALVVAAGVLPAASVAVSLGGGRDAGRDLSPEGLSSARRIQATASAALGARPLRPSSLTEAIAMRREVYRRALDGRPPTVYVNVGGNHASLGGANASSRHTGGWLAAPADGVAGGTSVMNAFLSEGVPALSLLDVESLSRAWGLEDRGRTEATH
jgi:poly-gamma-glutamate system protein